MKYNYVIFGTDSGLMNYSYSDLDGMNGVIRMPGLKKIIGWKYPLYRFHFSREVNKMINLPLKNKWNPIYFMRKFDDTKPLCFLMFDYMSDINHEVNIIDYWKKKYPDSKYVFFLQDLFKIKSFTYYYQPVDVERYKSQYDLILSFDQNDCEKYGFVYHPLVFSSFHGEIKRLPDTDVYFLGKAKDRMPEIISAFEYLKSHNLKLDFYLTEVPEDKQVYKDDIHYISSMSYEDNLQHVMHSKCLLEIMQHGGSGYTQRGAEAVCFGKKLLTNNSMIQNEPFYNETLVCQFSNINEINRDFLNRIPLESEVDYNYKQQMSPIELLEFIDERL